MTNQKFAEAATIQVKDVWRLVGRQQDLVLEALHFLYGSIANRAMVAESIELSSKEAAPEHAGFLFQVQQTICWTPLRFFLKTLVEDPSVVIRAAAKGELIDREGSQWSDSEAALMGNANIVVMGAGLNERLLQELNQSDALKKAQGLWQESGIRIPFAPGLVVTMIGSVGG